MKILFNCLPPQRIDIPSSGLSYLKGFLKEKKIQSEIIYWNLLMEDILMNYIPFTNENDFIDANTNTVHRILPFIDILNNYNYINNNDKLIWNHLQNINPSLKYINNNAYKELIDDCKARLDELICNTLEKVDLSNYNLIGISAKYEQWIPGLVLLKYFKEKAPHIRTIIGGIGNKESAEEIMKSSTLIDFAIWGEAEFPLMELFNTLLNNSEEYSHIPSLIYREKGIPVTSKRQLTSFVDLNSDTYPDYEDFMRDIVGNYNYNQIILPLVTKRGCHWSKCKFCIEFLGYKYRERIPENTIREIEYFTKKYGIFNYNLSEPDTVGKNKDEFLKFIELLINLSKKKQVNYSIECDLIHFNFTEDIIKKMAFAGFKRMLIGYESNIDRTNEILRKKTDFADNIITLKFALKYKILIVAAFIMDLPEETKSDIYENLNNLHYQGNRKK